MGQLVVQQFVSADGFAANARGEFDLFNHVQGDPGPFNRCNAAWLERVGAIVEAIGRLKEEIAGDLIVWGSLSLTYRLLGAGAVDDIGAAG